MKKILSLVLLGFSLIAFSQEAPKVLKTKFSKLALSQKAMTTDGKLVKVSDILAKHKGKIVVVDMWATWCKDCIAAMPEAEKLKEKNPNVAFVYFSLDRNKEAWLKGLEKHNLAKSENYWFTESWKNKFNEEIDLKWIPRFLVVDQKGAIAKYYAILPQDPDIQKTIDELSK